jgi:murein L,D-transpeptidase YcbB/YkuD
LVTPLQCLLKQQGFYNFKVTGSWNTPTLKGLESFQAKRQHPVRHWASPSDWTSLLSAGNKRTVLRAGASNSDVTRVQRAMNAATRSGLSVTGTYDAATVAAVKTYQRQVGLNPTGVVGSAIWWRLEAGKY